MDMPQFLDKRTFQMLLKQILDSSKSVAESLLKKAACLFNEGSHSLLLIMNSLGIDCGPNSHRYTENRDSERINLANRRANENTREGRMLRRQHQLDVLEVSKSAEALLYGPDDPEGCCDGHREALLAGEDPTNMAIF